MGWRAGVRIGPFWVSAPLTGRRRPSQSPPSGGGGRDPRVVGLLILAGLLLLCCVAMPVIGYLTGSH